ncbi:hypothetical protein Taro_025396 [Colocasia esculenta]|uniref:Uncharacterized protein n=1 Tax=Colocasia esculenta TaxID=4460 RepID=A0A843VC48_COLES|nr:hypothetical protein [Colocasia esculenta]
MCATCSAQSGRQEETPAGQNCREFCSARGRGAAAIFAGIRGFGMIVPWEARVEREKRRGRIISRVLREVRVRRTFRYRHPVRSLFTAVLDQHLQQCSFFSQLY